MRKLMEYKIISGRTVEIKRTWMPKEPGQKKQRGIRRAGASSEKKIRANEKDTVRRLARIINCNFREGDVFASLTYDADHYPEGFTYEQAKNQMKKCLRKLRDQYRKKTGRKLKAIWVTANWSPKKQSPARIHQHIIIPDDATEMLRKLWQEFGGIGTFKMETMDARGDHSDLAGYMLENVHDRPANENKWSCCRGMDKPVFTEPVEVYDIEDVQPIKGSVVKDVVESRDEEGRVSGKYIRCVLRERPKICGGQIVMPKKGRSKCL